MSKITLCTIQEHAIDFGARIYTTAAIEDREAIAEYGAALLVGARIGSRTQFAFMVAMENCSTQAYEDFTVGLLENELALLENEIAKLVARLSAAGKRV